MQALEASVFFEKGQFIKIRRLEGRRVGSRKETGGLIAKVWKRESVEALERKRP
jgi:hypothetical protein